MSEGPRLPLSSVSPPAAVATRAGGRPAPGVAQHAHSGQARLDDRVEQRRPRGARFREAADANARGRGRKKAARFAVRPPRSHGIFDEASLSADGGTPKFRSQLQAKHPPLMVPARPRPAARPLRRGDRSGSPRRPVRRSTPQPAELRRSEQKRHLGNSRGTSANRLGPGAGWLNLLLVVLEVSLRPRLWPRLDREKHGPHCVTLRASWLSFRGSDPPFGPESVIAALLVTRIGVLRGIKCLSVAGL